MSKVIIYNGQRYILESELPEEYSWDEEEIPLSAKEKEAEDEIAQADESKKRVSGLYARVSDKVNTIYYKYVKHYNTPEELKNLLRAVYEIIAKRYMQARKYNNTTWINQWEELIREIPRMQVLEENYMNNPVSDMVNTYFYVIGNVDYAIAFIFAISQRLEDLAKEDTTGEAEFDEIKEKLDTQLERIMGI